MALSTSCKSTSLTISNEGMRKPPTLEEIAGEPAHYCKQFMGQRADTQAVFPRAIAPPRLMRPGLTFSHYYFMVNRTCPCGQDTKRRNVPKTTSYRAPAPGQIQTPKRIILSSAAAAR